MSEQAVASVQALIADLPPVSYSGLRKLCTPDGRVVDPTNNKSSENTASAHSHSVKKRFW